MSLFNDFLRTPDTIDTIIFHSDYFKRVFIVDVHNGLLNEEYYSPITGRNHASAYIGNTLLNVVYNYKTGKFDHTITTYMGGGKTKNVSPKAKTAIALSHFKETFKDLTILMFPATTEIVMSGNTISYEEECKFLQPLENVDKEMYDFIISEMQYSVKEDLKLNWSKAGKLPKLLTTTSRLTTTPTGETQKEYSSHWLLFHEDGSVTFPEIAPSTGAHIDSETKRILEVYHAPAPFMPKTVVKAICIVIGANYIEDLDEQHGIAWELFKR